VARNKYKYECDEKVISAFLGNFRTADIVRESGLSRTTVQKLKTDPDFQRVLTERRDAVIRASVDKMRTYLLTDVEKLQEIIDDTETSPQTRVNAIQVVLSQLRSWIETDDILKRLEALEATQRDEL